MILSLQRCSLKVGPVDQYMVEVKHLIKYSNIMVSTVATMKGPPGFKGKQKKEKKILDLSHLSVEDKPTAIFLLTIVKHNVMVDGIAGFMVKHFLLLVRRTMSK